MLEKNIITKLTEAGEEAYFVGGCVRDKLLGLNPMDLDIATSADYNKAREILKGVAKLEEVGKNFGVLLVGGVEVAQFRSETYEVNGKPSISSATLMEDASRRDFTINAMYETLDGEIVDLFGGKEDIKNKVIRAVGDPNERFTEDSSRILRAFYLASKLGFDIEDNTLKAMKNFKHELLNVVPNELKGKIILKAIKGGNFTRFMKLIMDADMMDAFIPELTHLNGLPQNPKYHIYHQNAWEHVLDVLNTAEQTLPKNTTFLLGALFHDVAKGLEGIRGVNKVGEVNDLGHEEAGVPITKKVILRLGLGLDVAREVTFYVGQHGWKFNSNNGDVKDKTFIKCLKKLTDFAKDREDLKKKIKLLVVFTMCDSHSFTPELQKEIKQTMKQVLEKVDSDVYNDVAFYNKDLALNGSDIMKLNPKITGRYIGLALDNLLVNNVRDKEKAEKIVKNLTVQKLDNFEANRKK